MGWEEVSHKGRGVAAKCERENGRVQLESSTRTPSSEEAKKPTCPQAAAAITAPDRGGSPPHHTAVAKREGGRKELNCARVVPGLISRVCPPAF